MLRSLVKRCLHPILRASGRSLVRQHDVEELELWRYTAAQSVDLLEMLLAARHAAGEKSTVVQVGANDGVRDDPLRPLIERYQLDALLIEPQPRAFQRLLSNYAHQPQLKFENAAVGPQPGQLELFAFEDETEANTRLDVFTTSERMRLESLKRARGIHSPIVSLRCPVLPLHTLLERHQIRSITALMIDAEGYEPQIFRSFDLARTQPQLIQFEHVNLSRTNERTICELLVQHGYRLSRGRWETTAMR